MGWGEARTTALGPTTLNANDAHINILKKLIKCLNIFSQLNKGGQRRTRLARDRTKKKTSFYYKASPIWPIDEGGPRFIYEIIMMPRCAHVL